MSYVPLYTNLPDLFNKKTRTITIIVDDYGVPKGEYTLVELYCDDINCDCRRVFIEVISCESKESIATIAYGWENKTFYKKWFGAVEGDEFDNAVVDSLKGPVLNDLSKQSKYASAMLKIINDLALKDKEYISRLKKHYKLFREMLNTERKENNSNHKIGRNDACFCGSGKKYKKCCLNK